MEQIMDENKGMDLTSENVDTVRGLQRGRCAALSCPVQCVLCMQRAVPMRNCHIFTLGSACRSRGHWQLTTYLQPTTPYPPAPLTPCPPPPPSGAW